MGVPSVGVILCVAFLLGTTDAQKSTYKVCAPSSKISQECQSLEKGASTVTCVEASDSVDCLLKMDSGLADFSLVTAEETILAAMAQPDRYKVLASLRHEDMRYSPFAFQSVAIVPSTHKGGIAALSGGKFCHPGYGKGKEQLWSGRVLKYFEMKTAMGSRSCDSKSQSSAEDSARSLSGFFSEACRPGPWVSDKDHDKNLKTRYPSLCSLCTSDGSPDCNGYRYFEPRAIPGAPVNSHLSAIECLVSKKGTVAYVAYHHVLDYFRDNTAEMEKYSLLCENGTLAEIKADTLGQNAPCAWIKQPWGSIIARAPIADDLLGDLRKWMPAGRSDGTTSWIESLDSILIKEKSFVLEYINQPVSTTDYVTRGRPLPVHESNPCHKTLRWCTTSDAEQSKCAWLSAAALTVGITPEFECKPAASEVDCIKIIKDGGADFLSVDSNLGYLARKYYDLSSTIYCETTKTLSSHVIGLIKEKTKDSITRFENLKDKNVCFPEFGGIAWVAFLRAAHERKILSSKECDYAHQVAEFFRAACAPGAKDPHHFPSKVANPAKLCDACRGFSPRGGNEQGIVGQMNDGANGADVCAADSSNKFYGTTGALRCLSEPDSHVAFLEVQYLDEKAKNLSLSPSDFRVLCRNGSLAMNTGFQVDDACALSVTIDSEVVSRRVWDDDLSLQLLLQELDVWFGYNTASVKLIDLMMFSPFNGTKDLLFKDSTVGLATSNSDNEMVTNYVDLFKHVDDCTGGAASNFQVMMPVLATLISAIFAQAILTR